MPQAWSAPRARCWLALSLLPLLSSVRPLHANDAAQASAPTDQEFPAPRPSSPIGPVRGMTLGPIESTLHSERGYGTEHSARAMRTARELGADWISVTPFGRIWNLEPSGIDLRFEAPTAENRRRVASVIEQAHARGLEVMLVPHLWVEQGGWRGEIDFPDDAGWQAWKEAYQGFVTYWARLAEENDVELFSMGVELRSWVTTTRAPSFFEVIAAVREVYGGPLTYAANWDDAAHTVIWGELDVIGVNAFFPLTDERDASLEQLVAGGRRVAAEVAQLAELWQKSVLFTEIGYTNRPDPALRPWEWPEDLAGVAPDPGAQARAYHGLLAGFVDQPWFAGFFVWRMYADPFDLSQEPAWGFSPLHRAAELVLRDAYATRWASDPPDPLVRAPRAHRVGVY